MIKTKAQSWRDRYPILLFVHQSTVFLLFDVFTPIPYVVPLHNTCVVTLYHVHFPNTCANVPHQQTCPGLFVEEDEACYKCTNSFTVTAEAIIDSEDNSTSLYILTPNPVPNCSCVEVRGINMKGGLLSLLKLHVTQSESHNLSIPYVKFFTCHFHAAQMHVIFFVECLRYLSFHLSGKPWSVKMVYPRCMYALIAIRGPFALDFPSTIFRPCVHRTSLFFTVMAFPNLLNANLGWDSVGDVA